MIIKIKDTNFQGFICGKCGRELKHAFSLDGHGTYGSECILKIAGQSSKSQINKQLSINKIWIKITNNPDVYSLKQYIKEYGSLETVRRRFFEKGYLN